MVDARPCGVGRLDLAHAGRAAHRATARAHNRGQAPADRAGARDRARRRQAGNARSLSHACSVRRQSRGRAGGLARLFRQGAAEAHPGRGGAAGRAAAIARSAPAGSLASKRRAPRATACSTGSLRGASSAPPTLRRRSASRFRKRAWPFLRWPRTPPRKRSPPTSTRKSSSSRSTRACRRSSRRSPKRASRVSGRSCRRRSSSSTMQAAKFAPAWARPIMTMPRATARSTCRARPARRARRSSPSSMRSLSNRASPIRRRGCSTGPMRYGAYAPENFNLGYEGAVTARKALQMSLNLPAVELLSDVGPATFPRPAAQRGRRDRAAERYADRPRHRPWRARDLAHRSRAALRRLRARRRGAAADRAARRSAAGHRRAPCDRSGRGLSMSGTSCAARRRPPMRSKAGSPSRPARPTAFAMRWRSASTGGQRLRSGSGGPTMARRPA